MAAESGTEGQNYLWDENSGRVSSLRDDAEVGPRAAPLIETNVMLCEALDEREV